MPAKLVRDWTELFLAGKPLHDVEETTSLLADNALEPLLTDDKHLLLNDADFSEYQVFCH